MATLTVSIDRTDMGLAALVLYGHEVAGSKLGISDFQAPGRQARVRYAGDSDHLHGSVAVASTWQQALLSFDVLPDVTSEAELQQVIGELRAAVERLTYTTTVTINDGTPEVWRCDMGSVVAEPRTLENLSAFDVVHTVTIPCYPIPGV